MGLNNACILEKLSGQFCITYLIITNEVSFAIHDNKTMYNNRILSSVSLTFPREIKPSKTFM